MFCKYYPTNIARLHALSTLVIFLLFPSASEYSEENFKKELTEINTFYFISEKKQIIFTFLFI